MLDSLILLLVLAAVVFFWQDALRANELARRMSQRICADAQVQLLDQTVALRRLGLSRNADGRLGLRRWYSFELSTDGQDRHRGNLRMAHGRLEDYSLPVMAAASPPAAGRLL